MNTDMQQRDEVWEQKGKKLSSVDLGREHEGTECSIHDQYVRYGRCHQDMQ